MAYSHYISIAVGRDLEVAQSDDSMRDPYTPPVVAYISPRSYGFRLEITERGRAQGLDGLHLLLFGSTQAALVALNDAANALTATA